MNNHFEKQIQNIVDGVDNEEPIDYTEEPAMLPVVYEEKPTNIQEFVNEDLKEDYEFARSNIYGLIGKANASLELLLKIAQTLETPSALEIATGLLDSSAKLTKDLLALQKHINNVDGETPKGKKSPVYTQYNTVNNYSKPSPGKEEKEASSIIDALPDEGNE